MEAALGFGRHSRGFEGWPRKNATSAKRTEFQASGWQKDRLKPGADCEVMLLLIRSDEMVESKFHHGNVEQVGGFNRKALAVFLRQVQGGVERFIE
jgi:hypothetical protein